MGYGRDLFRKSVVRLRIGQADNHPLRCRTGESRYPWRGWIPASAGMTKKEAMLSCVQGIPTVPR
jgi:hypothetical protein